jgi:hypothetical protein
MLKMGILAKGGLGQFLGGKALQSLSGLKTGSRWNAGRASAKAISQFGLQASRKAKSPVTWTGLCNGIRW